MPEKSSLPSSKRLASGLAIAFKGTGFGNGEITLLDRRPNPYNSTFPTEIVTCHNGHDSTLRLFIKYGTTMRNNAYGHRGDVSYEARVYREVLAPLKTTAPAFYGSFRDKQEHADWLVIEYLPGGHRASWTRDPKAMIRSAQWIGRFHALNEKRVSNGQLKFLRTYDRDYYVGWAHRTKQFFEYRNLQLKVRFPWIPDVCKKFEESLPSLLETRRTIIHGECFGSNIVYQNGTSRPIDWQSAAIAPGEIDLASLTLAWPKPFVKRLEKEYEKSRWPDGAPDSFPDSLEVARLYMGLRWLGDTRLMSQWFKPQKRFVIPKDPRRIIAELHSIGERLEAI